LKSYLKEVVSIAASIDSNALEAAIKAIDTCSRSGGTVYAIGNGGSAAISSHFVTDLVKSGYFRRANIKAISLSDNTPLLTATGNDFSYEEVFSWQVSQYMSNSDLLFAISSSGKSRNIELAITTAKELGATTIALTGFDGGVVAEIAQLSLWCRSNIGSYGAVEDSHSIVCHYIAQTLRKI
jgi:D-sedoheptulose 7-phosphate isomerase